jgi:opacity protein-like surface antigen
MWAQNLWKSAGLTLATVTFVTSVAVGQAPPAPRPWNSQAAPVSSESSPYTPGGSAPMTEANGSRLRVTDSAVQQSQGAPAQPQFKNEAPLRESRGTFYVGGMVGINVAQSDDINQAGTNVDGGVAPMGGLKFGYVYPFDSEPIDQFMDETHGDGVRLAGALELEAFYVRNDADIQTSTNSGEFNLDSGYFMVNALLKGRYRKFGVYAGPGVGLAYTHASGSGLAGSQDDANLAYQFLGGLEYECSPQWSVFAEYKWLVNDGLNLNVAGNTGVDFGAFNQNLFMLGLKRSF